MSDTVISQVNGRITKGFTSWTAEQNCLQKVGEVHLIEKNHVNLKQSCKHLNQLIVEIRRSNTFKLNWKI